MVYARSNFKIMAAIISPQATATRMSAWGLPGLLQGLMTFCSAGGASQIAVFNGTSCFYCGGAYNCAGSTGA